MSPTPLTGRPHAGNTTLFQCTPGRSPEPLRCTIIGTGTLGPGVSLYDSSSGKICKREFSNDVEFESGSEPRCLTRNDLEGFSVRFCFFFSKKRSPWSPNRESSRATTSRHISCSFPFQYTPGMGPGRIPRQSFKVVLHECTYRPLAQQHCGGALR